MKLIPEQALAFLTDNRISVFAIEMPDGAPHAATVHFAHQEDPLTFIFLTDRTFRKAEPLLDGKEVRAALVIGTDESQMRTLQLNGMARITDDTSIAETYFTKFPQKQEKHSGSNDVFIAFTPTWWRYTDYKAPGGKLIISSDQ